MKLEKILATLSLALGLSLVPAGAMAQPADTDPGEKTGDADKAGETSGDPDEDETQIGEGTDPDDLPPPKSDNDPQPEVPAPAAPWGGVVKQAGVGGSVSYARRGVLEMGGSAGLTAATDFTQVSFTPSVGWFITDNFELSAIMGYNYAKAEGNSRTLFTALAEPSIHIPFNKTMFGFGGVGMGLGYVQGAGTGFALAPRLGMNFLVGRSGILTPAAFLQYTTHEATQTPMGTLLAVSVSTGLQVGYTVMW